MNAGPKQARCIYINLDRSTARNTHMAEQFSRLGIATSRFSAVDGTTLSDTELARINATRSIDRTLSPGEIGCFQSHHTIWGKIASGDMPYVAVFEDDIKLANNAAAFLMDFSWIPAGVDFIKLDTTYQRVLLSRAHTAKVMGRRIAKMHSSAWGTAGYIVSKSCAARLCEQLATVRAPVDIQLFEPDYETFADQELWQVQPPLCVQQIAAVKTPFLPAGAETTTIGIPQDRAMEPPREKLRFGFAKIKREFNRVFEDRAEAKLRQVSERHVWMAPA